MTIATARALTPGQTGFGRASDEGRLGRRHLLGWVSAAWLPATPGWAQMATRVKLPLVAVLALGAPEGGSLAAVDRLRGRLRELGWIEMQTVRFEARWARGRPERLPALMGELLALEPDVIWTAGSITALAAKAATPTVPIVFASSADPIALGLVASLARPGGNVTGLSNLVGDYAPKLLQLLRQMLPDLRRVAFLGDYRDASTSLVFQRLKMAAPALNITVVPAPLTSAESLDDTFELIGRERSEAVYQSPDLVTSMLSPRIDEHVTRLRLPAIGLGGRGSVSKSHVLSYGPGYVQMQLRSVDYVDRILRGASPRDMPVEQSTRFDLVVNLRASRALGLNLPRSLLLIADEVIE